MKISQLADAADAYYRLKEVETIREHGDTTDGYCLKFDIYGKENPFVADFLSDTAYEKIVKIINEDLDDSIEGLRKELEDLGVELE